MRRDFGPREDRQKTRLMWLVEDMGVDKFRDTIAQYMGDTLRPGVHEQVLPVHTSLRKSASQVCSSGQTKPDLHILCSS